MSVQSSRSLNGHVTSRVQNSDANDIPGVFLGFFYQCLLLVIVHLSSEDPLTE